MSKDTKTAQAILSLVDELRGMRSANVQLSGAVGRMADEIAELRGQVEERNASHRKTTTAVTDLDQRVTRLERANGAAE